MNVRTRLPWISVTLAAIVSFNPLGLDVIHSAFFSAEALARNIWQPIALSAIAIMVLAVVLEWWIRALLINRRQRGTKTA